ncbi:protein kinase domain-containing protein [Frateuria hangzhouensis]|uniref:protein kinase domain-containing protein n=1 Tax=Frateuria hangzhouensis TaxID=2995589 RepID=UPI002260980D|nr:protein kinase [Frateuria sp. STR12]MCX7514070.1 protein kinase [Frateuria sp. STR12]
MVAGLIPAADERVIPPTVGRYRIEGMLGAGAMAVVYAGFDPEIERRVAIKCLRNAVAADPAYRARFITEARAVGHLTHPHIVTLFDVGEMEDGRPYIAMERLSGDTLASRVAREGLPALPLAIGLVEQIASALDYAHAQGVIHQDIKPENIMLSDGWQHAKVSDFGIAERRDLRGSGKPRGEIGGTPAFMAPEHLRGERTDARSDLFSLGVVLFWLLSGKLPWEETGDVRRLLAERQRLPQPTLQPRDPFTPSILLDIVQTLLAPAPQDRYQRGSELIDDLRLALREYERLHDKPITTRLISLRLRWAGILAAVLSLTLLIGLAAIYARQNTAVTGLAQDFGRSLGRMVASEAAENLLLDDRAATRALVQDISRNQQIYYLAVANRYGEVIASTRKDELGQPLPVRTNETYLPGAGDIASYRVRLPDGDDPGEMLVFDVPVHYQTAKVGQLRLGISDAPLRAAQKTTLKAIVAVLLVTLAAVTGAAYWLFRRLLGLLDVLGEAMLRVGRGDFRHRIRLVRHDELGRLFTAFNLMSNALQARERRPRRTAAKPTAPLELPTRILPTEERVEDKAIRD